MAPREVMAFRATEEPMLIRERSALMVRETQTAGRGMFHPGETWKLLAGDLEGMSYWPYLGEPCREGKTSISSE